MEDFVGFWVASLDLGATSAVGEPSGDLLVEVEGPERRPERRGSLGEGGGPIEAMLAMTVSSESGTSTRRGWRREHRAYGTQLMIF